MRLLVPLLALGSVTLGLSLLLLAAATWSNEGLDAIPYVLCAPGTLLVALGGVLAWRELLQARVSQDRGEQA